MTKKKSPLSASNSAKTSIFIRIFHNTLRKAGFSLLEVLIALSILSLGLMVLLDAQGGSVLMTLYAKNVTMATQLARAKMAQLEQQIEDRKLTFSLSKSVCQDGDFSDDGPSFKGFKWKYCVKKVDISVPSQLPGMGKAENEDDQKAQGGNFMSALGLPQGASGLAAMAGSLGPMLGMIKGQMKMIFEQLQKSLREVQLTISWKQGAQTYKVQIATHIFNFNPSTGLPQGWPAQAPNQGGQ